MVYTNHVLAIVLDNGFLIEDKAIPVHARQFLGNCNRSLVKARSWYLIIYIGDIRVRVNDLYRSSQWIIWARWIQECRKVAIQISLGGHKCTLASLLITNNCFLVAEEEEGVLPTKDVRDNKRPPKRAAKLVPLKGINCGSKIVSCVECSVANIFEY